ncbi:hypothetical protein [Streptomyces coeruleorubidus]
MDRHPRAGDEGERSAALRDLDAAELRERIGAVFQDYMEYDMTAAENAAVGDLDALGSPERSGRRPAAPVSTTG